MRPSTPWNRVEPLNDSHNILNFHSSPCENQPNEIDKWLHCFALKEQQKRSTTHVCLKDNKVVAYYSLAIIAVDLSEASKRMQKRYGASNSAIPHSPAVLITKLGLHAQLQGKGYGSLLFQQACRTIVKMNNEYAAIRLIIVDSLTEELIEFYTKQGMTRINESSLRLTVGVSTIKRLLEGQKNSAESTRMEDIVYPF